MIVIKKIISKKYLGKDEIKDVLILYFANNSELILKRSIKKLYLFLIFIK